MKFYRTYFDKSWKPMQIHTIIYDFNIINIINDFEDLIKLSCKNFILACSNIRNWKKWQSMAKEFLCTLQTEVVERERYLKKLKSK